MLEVKGNDVWRDGIILPMEWDYKLSGDDNLRALLGYLPCHVVSTWDQLKNVWRFTWDRQLRVVVRQDEFSDCPLDWSDGAVIGTNYPGNSISSWNLHNNYDAQCLQEVIEAAREYGQNPVEAALKHAKRNGIAVQEFSTRGYSQGDWYEGIFVGEYGLSEFVKWLWGDVNMLTLEASEDGEIWSVVDSVSGVYLEGFRDDEEVLTLAGDNFGYFNGAEVVWNE